MFMILFNVFKFLVTPHERETTEEYGVRLLLTGLVFGLIVAFAAHYAYAADHFADKQDVTDLQQWSLERDIIDVIKWECKAEEQNNTDARAFAYERKQKLLRQYRVKIGEPFPTPNCDQVRQS